MPKSKNIKMFSAVGLLALTGIFRQINLSTPTPTPTFIPVFTFKPVATMKPIVPIKPIKIDFQNIGDRGDLMDVKVTAKDATSITIDNGGTSVKVDVQTATHFRREFWGKSDIGEISVGDSVDVIGRWANTDKTEIKAVLIRDLSIQKRQGVFFGTVKSITDTGFVMTTIQRGTETVDMMGAKLIGRKEQTIKASDIQVGDIIRVRGLWDKSNFTVTEVTEVKDFSLPSQP